MAKDCLYRISLTQAGLETGYFIGYGLPMPELPFFQSYTNRRPQSTGGQARQGYKFLTLLWARLDVRQANIIEGFVIDDPIYLTLPRVDAAAGGVEWIDVSGIPIMPNWETEQQSHGQTYVNVQLRLNNVEVINEPSTAV